MSATRFSLFLRDGSVVSGAIHGSGGLIASRDCRRVATAMDLATAGRPTGLFEPRPGFARVYTNPTALDAGSFLDVDLRCARGVSLVRDEEHSS